MMSKPRDTFRYHLKVGRTTVYRGVTNDLKRREAEHKIRWPGAEIKRMGRRTTREAALKWEREGGKEIRSSTRRTLQGRTKK